MPSMRVLGVLSISLAVASVQCFAPKVEIQKYRHGGFGLLLVTGTVKVPEPLGQFKVEARLDVEWTLGVKHPANAFGHYSWSSQWHKMTWGDHAGVSIGTTIGQITLVENTHLMARPVEKPGRKKSDDTTSDDVNSHN